MTPTTTRVRDLSDSDVTEWRTDIAASTLDGADSSIGVVVLEDGGVAGLVRLSSAEAAAQLPTVHADRGSQGLDPLKDQLTAAHMGDLLNAMAAAHVAAQGD